ncbi:MAG: MFS transporter [Candidatus Colwellbacteria bacterium]|nr:MFS transporter [Candidatus Colwellbacteria bacterium]
MGKSLKILFITNGIFVFAAALLGPLYAIYVWGINKALLSVSFSWFAFLASSIIFTYLVSLWGDKIKETEYLLLLSYLIRAVAWFLFIFAASIPAVIGIQVILGVGEALGAPSFGTILAEHLPQGRYVRAYSDYQMINLLVSAVGVLLGGVIVSQFGFNTLFVSMSILALAATFITAIQPRELL